MSDEPKAGVEELGSLVTAIVPMHNAARTIEATLASIAAQTVAPAGVIVVDDASSDNSVELINALDKPRFTLIQLDHSLGAGGARNAAVASATTEWIALLDSDDLWQPTFLEETLGAAIKLDADFASSGEIRTLRNGKSTKRLLARPAEASDLTDSFWRTALKFVPAHTSATVIRRSAFNAVGGYPTNIRTGEDWVLWARLWLRGRFVFVNKPLAQWIQIEGGLTTYGKPYREEWTANIALGRLVARAIRMRHRGAGWFTYWYIRTVIKHQFVWARKRLGRSARGRDLA